MILGLLPHIARLSRDPWSQAWRIPGRSLALVLVQGLPLAFGFLMVWCLVGRWIVTPFTRKLVRVSIASTLMLFSVFDGAYSAIAERHVLEPGQLAFLFRDGALRAASFLSPVAVLAIAALLVACAYLLVASWADVPRRPPVVATLASLAVVFAIDVAVLMNAPPGQRDLYEFAINSNPVFGLTNAASRVAVDVKPGVKTTVRGLHPQGIFPPRSVAVPSRPLVEPRLFFIIQLDGLRADFLTPERAPRLHALATDHGVAVKNYYAAYAGTDRSVYSLFFGKHPLFADQDFLLGAKPNSPWIDLLRGRAYSLEVFQSNPFIYRFLPPLYGEFDEVHYGTADLDARGSDEAMLKSLERRVASLKPGGRLFAYVLLHSTHFPYNGKRLGSPEENYADAVSYLDARVGDLLQGLVDGGASFLALVGGDHGTQLGECGSYKGVSPQTLHTALAAIGSADVSPVIERFEQMQGSMLRVESLLPFVLDPETDPVWLQRPAAQWNVAMAGGAFGMTAPLTVHNLAGDAMRVELGRNSATWLCGSLDGCGSYTTASCRGDLMSQAGSALLEFQRGPSATPRD